MRVSSFMVPASKVVTCGEWDAITNIIDSVMDRDISCVVVVDDDTQQPKGIVTKTDLVRAYQKGINVHQKVGVIMSRDLLTIQDSDHRDDAAKFLDEHHTHHALVTSHQDGSFVGLVSSFDIASEVAKDSRAWPYHRTDDGRISHPMVH